MCVVVCVEQPVGSLSCGRCELLKIGFHCQQTLVPREGESGLVNEE